MIVRSTLHRLGFRYVLHDDRLPGRPDLVVFPGSGISANLADKAKKLGIPVWKFGESGA